ncbi:MAG TPA: preprotein translocase subunit YajC [Hyphomonas atlantica]|uniref:Sec translocon accessory complex subunit YajC n=2 Tax=Hyphomonas TaxID=85 RepID=A0A356W940_9PROT|nr:preprotein translocase subunit YajC [Hyphomonas atlantica]
MSQVLLFLPLILIFYFLLIRPQQQRSKKHKALIENIKKGDTIVTSGGIVGKVTKPGDEELTVELAEGVRVQIIKQMVIDVRGKNQPVAAND